MPNKKNGFYGNIGINTDNPFSKYNKNISALTNPAVIAAIPVMAEFGAKKLNDFSRATSQLIKSVSPDFSRFNNIIVETANIFDKLLKSEYEFKKDIKSKWNNFVEEVKLKSNNLPNSPFLLLFEKCLIEASYTLYKGSTFFRARNMDIAKFSEQVNILIERLSERYEEFDFSRQFNNENDFWDFLSALSLDDLENVNYSNLDLKNILFWGYNEIDSDAPPVEKSKAGRANQEGVTCLYAAEDEKTAILEIHPSSGHIISVAEIGLKKDLILFNFDFYKAFSSEFLEKTLPEIKEELGISFEKLRIIFETVSELFSRPSLGKSENYIATQYLSEYIKSKGFDGIVYKSSLVEKGINIVLFDTSKDDNGNPVNYIIKNSKLHKIDKVEIQYKPLLPKENTSDNE